MTVNQAIAYKTLAQGLRIILDKKPEGLLRRVMRVGNAPENVRTRSDKGGLQRARVGYQGEKGWTSRFILLYQTCPEHIRALDPRKSGGKRQLRQYIQSTVEWMV